MMKQDVRRIGLRWDGLHIETMPGDRHAVLVRIEKETLLTMLQSRCTPTPLTQVLEEVGPSAFAEFEKEFIDETLVFHEGKAAALTPTAYYRIIHRVAKRHGGRLP